MVLQCAAKYFKFIKKLRISKPLSKNIYRLECVCVSRFDFVESDGFYWIYALI